MADFADMPPLPVPQIVSRFRDDTTLKTLASMVLFYKLSRRRSTSQNAIIKTIISYMIWSRSIVCRIRFQDFLYDVLVDRQLRVGDITIELMKRACRDLCMLAGRGTFRGVVSYHAHFWSPILIYLVVIIGSAMRQWWKRRADRHLRQD